MITFIWIVALLIVGLFGWMIASGATKRKRSRQAGQSEVNSEQAGGGAPSVGRASGIN